MINFYRHIRESMDHADDVLRAARRKDWQAVRASLRLIMVSAEQAMREIPDEKEGAE
jgi:hypothetical protein